MFAFTARYNGPDSSQGAAADDMDGGKKHCAILDTEYTYNKVSTQKGDNTRLKRWYDYCKDRGFPDCHPYPAHRVYTYLEVDLDRNAVKGNRGIDRCQQRCHRCHSCQSRIDRQRDFSQCLTRV